MGFKRLGRIVLLSLAVFAGAGELCASSDSIDPVSANLSIANREARPEQKKSAPGFGAYLRKSAKILATTFVVSLEQGQRTSAHARQGLKRPSGFLVRQALSHSIARSALSGAPQHYSAIIAWLQNEDLGRAVPVGLSATGCPEAAPSRPFPVQPLRLSNCKFRPDNASYRRVFRALNRLDSPKVGISDSFSCRLFSLESGISGKRSNSLALGKQPKARRPALTRVQREPVSMAMGLCVVNASSTIGLGAYSLQPTPAKAIHGPCQGFTFSALLPNGHFTPKFI